MTAHTVSPQKMSGENFIDTEAVAVANILAAARVHNVQRLLYITSLGVGSEYVAAG